MWVASVEDWDARLDWGLLAGFEQTAVHVPKDLARTWQIAAESLELRVRPIERFELAGTLNHHPGHVRSDAAKRDFPAIFALAVASRSAGEPLRSQSRATAASALTAWAQTYRPTGNPIDEFFFVPLLQAVDLVRGSMPAEDEAAVLAWTHAFSIAGDRFFAPKSNANKARANNWTARRLLIRAVASTVAGDQAARAQTPELLRGFVARNYLTDPSGKRDGRTFDFLQRDALHYHMAAVEPLVGLTLYTPDLVHPPVRDAILSGLEFLRPFFLGQRQHIEFARTTVPFDLERRDAGNPVFANAPWDPAHARVLLRLARATFPEIRGWTEALVDAGCDPRTKLLAAIYGEPQRQLGWSAPTQA